MGAALDCTEVDWATVAARSTGVDPVPARVRIAAGLSFVQGVVNVFAGVSYWYLIGRPQISWWLTAVGAVVGAVFILVGIQLLRLRRWALIAGRVLAVFALFGAASTLTGTSAQHAGILLVTALRVLLGVAIGIALFMPGTDRAFAPQPATPQ
jgi:hypothetical protein